jgi:hypothetical protein
MLKDNGAQRQIASCSGETVMPCGQHTALRGAPAHVATITRPG